jgi:hypothetical protein
MTTAGKMKFKKDRSFATPEAAERKLLEIANAVEADHAGAPVGRDHQQAIPRCRWQLSGL